MESKPLLGRNAMIPLHAASIIDRMTISSIDADSLRVNYSNLFLPNIGKIPRAMHQINLKPNTVACSISQTRLVPLAKRHAVSEVLNRNGWGRADWSYFMFSMSASINCCAKEILFYTSVHRSSNAKPTRNCWQISSSINWYIGH